MLRVKLLFVGVSLLLTYGSLTWAQSDKRRTSINFEDELIQGEVKRPELLYLLQQKQFNYKKLIKLRENFLPEMERTAEDVQHSGSND